MMTALQLHELVEKHGLPVPTHLRFVPGTEGFQGTHWRDRRRHKEPIHHEDAAMLIFVECIRAANAAGYTVSLHPVCSYEPSYYVEMWGDHGGHYGATASSHLAALGEMLSLRVASCKSRAMPNERPDFDIQANDFVWKTYVGRILGAESHPPEVDRLEKAVSDALSAAYASGHAAGVKEEMKRHAKEHPPGAAVSGD